MPDGDGTMLEHSLFLYGSNMSNSNAHNHYPLPTSIVGGWKTVKGGQHLVLPEHTPLANVLLTMLDRAGIPQDKLGDSTGKLVESTDEGSADGGARRGAPGCRERRAGRRD